MKVLRKIVIDTTLLIKKTYIIVNVVWNLKNINIMNEWRNIKKRIKKEYFNGMEKKIKHLLENVFEKISR